MRAHDRGVAPEPASTSVGIPVVVPCRSVRSQRVVFVPVELGSSSAQRSGHYRGRSGRYAPSVSFFNTSFHQVPSGPDHEPPEWSEPPPGVLPAVSTDRAVLFDTGDALCVVDHFLVYPNGIEYTLNLFLRTADTTLSFFPWELEPHRATGSVPGDFLRFGVELSDGWRWSNLERFRGMDTDEPDRVLLPRGGGGGGRRWSQQHWMWPLPPDGDLTFVSEWPAHDVPETHVAINATSLKDRASEAVILWPESP